MLKLTARPSKVKLKGTAVEETTRAKFVPPAENSHVEAMAQAMSRMHAASAAGDNALMDAAFREELGIESPEKQRERLARQRAESAAADRKLAAVRAKQQEDDLRGFDAVASHDTMLGERDRATPNIEGLLLSQLGLVQAFEKASTRINHMIGHDAVGMEPIKTLCANVFHLKTLETICDSIGLSGPTRAIVLKERAIKLFGPTVEPVKAADSLTKRDLIQAMGAIGKASDAPVKESDRAALMQRFGRFNRPFGGSAPSNPFGDIPPV